HGDHTRDVEVELAEAVPNGLQAAALLEEGGDVVIPWLDRAESGGGRGVDFGHQRRRPDRARVKAGRPTRHGSSFSQRACRKAQSAWRMTQSDPSDASDESDTGVGRYAHCAMRFALPAAPALLRRHRVGYGGRCEAFGLPNGALPNVPRERLMALFELADMLPVGFGELPVKARELAARLREVTPGPA